MQLPCERGDCVGSSQSLQPARVELRRLHVGVVGERQVQRRASSASPSIASSPSARAQPRQRRVAVVVRRRSACRAASRRRAAPHSPDRACVSKRTPAPAGHATARHACRATGMKFLRRILGIDAHLDGVAAHGDVRLRGSASGSPPAMRIISRTRSMPVIISVTGCSTWMRVFISMKIEVAGRRRRRDIRACRRRGSRPLRQARTAEAQSASRTSARERRRRRLLPDLLAPPLQRAFALDSSGSTSLAVAEHLHLDMAGALDELSR